MAEALPGRSLANERPTMVQARCGQVTRPRPPDGWRRIRIFGGGTLSTSPERSRFGKLEQVSFCLGDGQCRTRTIGHACWSRWVAAVPMSCGREMSLMENTGEGDLAYLELGVANEASDDAPAYLARC